MASKDLKIRIVIWSTYDFFSSLLKMKSPWVIFAMNGTEQHECSANLCVLQKKRSIILERHKGDACLNFPFGMNYTFKMLKNRKPVITALEIKTRRTSTVVQAFGSQSRGRKRYLRFGKGGENTHTYTHTHTCFCVLRRPFHSSEQWVSSVHRSVCVHESKSAFCTRTHADTHTFTLRWHGLHSQ